MNKLKVQMQKEEVLYVIFFCVMLFAKGLGLYDGQTLYKVFLLFALGCVAIKMCITKYTKIEWLFIIGIGLLTGIVYSISKEKGILLCVAMVLGMKNVSAKRVFKIGAWIWGITMLGNMIFHILFLETSGYKVHEKLGLGHIFRWDLGFSHPNVLHIAYLTLVAFIIYNLGKEYNWKHMLLLMAGNLFVFLYSVSYTGIIVVTIYLGISWYVNIRKELNKFEYALLEMIFPLCLILSFLSPFILPEKIFNIVNKIFSTRLSLAKYFLVRENVKLLGNNLERITTYQLTMDNAYIFSFIIYGIIFFVLTTLSYLLTIHDCIDKKKNAELTMLVSFLIAGITEPFMFNTSFKNITFVLVGAYLWKVLDKETDKGTAKALLPLKNTCVSCDFIDLRELRKKIRNVWCIKKSKIIFISCVVWVAVSMCVNMVNVKPRGYIMPRKHVDMESEETWYLKSGEEPEYVEYIIKDYQNPETKMQIIEGNIVIVENVRKCISSGLVSVLFVGILVVFLEILKYGKVDMKKGGLGNVSNKKNNRR